MASKIEIFITAIFMYIVLIIISGLAGSLSWDWILSRDSLMTFGLVIFVSIILSFLINFIEKLTHKKVTFMTH